MKAFLLAAGDGTRLWPITKSIPKCLVPVRGEPMLGIWLELCRRSGINEVMVNLHAHADTVRHFLSGHEFGIKVQIAEEPSLLGSAGTLFANRHWVERDPYFWIFYADVLTNTDLDKMRVFHERSGMGATLGVYEVPDPSRCGIALVDENEIVYKFVEKPTTPVSNLAFSGLMIMSRTIIAELPTTTPADLGFDVIPRLCGRMVVYRISDYLVDVGVMANYKRVQASWPGLPKAA